VNFIDERVAATVIDSDMRRIKFQLRVEAINDDLAIPRTNGPMEIFYAPDGACFLGSTRNFRAKDDAGRRERNQATGNENSQTFMEAAFLKGLGFM